MAPARQLIVETAATPAAVRAVRRRLVDYLADTDVGGELTDRIQLVAAELLTNACEASPQDATIVLSVAPHDRTVTIEVANTVAGADSLDRLASIAMPPAHRERGRGLAIVAACAAQLSVDTNAHWVTVRAQLQAKG